jgi:hypothetical protein
LNPNAQDAVAAFKANGFDPQGYTLYSYAAVQIIKQAAEKANSVDPRKVAAVMHSGMAFQTVIGDIAYDKKGDRTTVDYVWYVSKKDSNGKIGFKQLRGRESPCAAPCVRSDEQKPPVPALAWQRASGANKGGGATAKGSKRSIWPVCCRRITGICAKETLEPRSRYDRFGSKNRSN